MREVENEHLPATAGARASQSRWFQFVDGYGLECHVFSAGDAREAKAEGRTGGAAGGSRSTRSRTEMWADDAVWLPLTARGRWASQALRVRQRPDAPTTRSSSATEQRRCSNSPRSGSRARPSPARRCSPSSRRSAASPLAAPTGFCLRTSVPATEGRDVPGVRARRPTRSASSPSRGSSAQQLSFASYRRLTRRSGRARSRAAGGAQRRPPAVTLVLAAEAVHCHPALRCDRTTTLRSRPRAVRADHRARARAGRPRISLESPAAGDLRLREAPAGRRRSRAGVRGFHRRSTSGAMTARLSNMLPSVPSRSWRGAARQPPRS